MRSDKINEHEYLITLDRPLGGAYELHRVTRAAMELCGIAPLVDISTESYTIGCQTMIFIHLAPDGLWCFDSLMSALDAAQMLPNCTVTLIRGRAGEWYINLPADAPFQEFGEYVSADTSGMPQIILHTALLQ